MRGKDGGESRCRLNTGVVWEVGQHWKLTCDLSHRVGLGYELGRNLMKWQNIQACL